MRPILNRVSFLTSQHTVMTEYTQSTSKPRPNLQHCWLLFAALTCMVGLYSLQVIHFHPSVKFSQEYPKSQVEKPVLLDGLLPELATLAVFTVSYHLDTPDPDVVPTPCPPRLKPQGRAPPSLYS
jgi:hypothetical protein